MSERGPKLLPALLLALCWAGGAQAQDLEGWLAGLAGRGAAVPREQLTEWGQRQADLPGALRRLAQEGAPRVRAGALRVLGALEGSPGDETEGVLVRCGERATDPVQREAAWAALAARGGQLPLGGLLGRVIVDQAEWRSLALLRCDLVADGVGVHELTRVALADRVPLPVRLGLVRRLGELGASQAANRIAALRLERGAMSWEAGRQLDCTVTVALLRLGAGDPEAALSLLLDAALDPDPGLGGEGLEGLRLLARAQVSEGLEGVLREPDPARRLRALQLVGLLPAGSPELMLQVESLAAQEDAQLPLRQAAVRALGAAGSVGSIPVLAAILDRRGSGDEAPLRREAADALGRLGRNDVGRGALERALTDDEAAVRRAALRGVCALEDPRSAEAMRELLRRRPIAPTSDERLLRVRAGTRLGLLESDTAERLLALRREDDDAGLAMELITYALAVTDQGQAIPALLDLLAHRGSAQVRGAAHAALLQRTHQAFPYDPELRPYDAANLERWRAWWRGAGKR